MKRKNATRSALFTSVISMLLCISMLVGTTFAWFTDSVTSAKNIIKSGKLDVEMYWADGTEAVPADDSTDWADASTGAIFNSTLWEPGYTEVRHIKIANEGTLALKYQLQIKANGEVSKLAEVIDVYFADPATTTDRAMTGMTRIGTLKEVLAGMPANVSGVLAADKDAKVTIALKMQESAGNEYQELAIGSDFSIVLVATQLTAELDSFDNQYDKDSQYPVLSNKDKEDNKDATVGAEGVEINIPAAAPAGNYSIEVSNKSETTDAAGNTTVAMDITLKKDGVKVEADGSIAYTVSVDIGAGLTNLKLNHNGEEIVDYDYNFTSGIVTFTTTHFSPFSFTYKDSGFVAAIDKVGYATLAEAFAEVEDDETITLLNDIKMSEGITNTKKVTLNLNGKTITGTDNATASFGLITNTGELTITGEGKMTLVATNNREWNAYSSVISNNPGGKLIVEKGTIQHLGGTDMAYGIDNLTNGKGTYAETIINGGTIKSTYRAVRQFLNGVEAQNILTVNAGTIEGANKSIWMQDPSKNANTGKLTVGKDAVLNGDVYLSVTAGSTEWPVEVSIAESAVKDEVLSGNVPAGYVVYKIDGCWTVLANTALVATADELAAALAAGRSAVLGADVEMEAATTAPYGNKYAVKLDGGVLDGNGNELYMECYGDDYGIMTSGGTIKNLTIKEGCRAVMIMYPQSDIILDNVNIGGDGVLYPINTGEAGAAGVKLIVTNSTLAGWTSYGLIESASFTNVEFKQGTYYNNIYGRVLKPYVNTTLTDCSFVEHMNLDLSNLGAGQKITMKNCTVNGQAVTADVFTVPTTDAMYDTELFTVDLPSWASSVTDCVIFE